MAIDAIALLRFRQAPLVPIENMKVQALDDHAVAVFLSERFHAFARGEAEASAVLGSMLEDVLDDHDDPRGVFVYPSVATPKATTYEGVIQEIGEAGVWVPVEVLDRDTEEDLGDSQQIGQLVMQLAQAVPPSVLMELQRAMMSGDMEAMARAQRAIPNLDMLAASVQQMFPGIMEAAQSMMEQQGTEEDALDMEKLMAQARAAMSPLVEPPAEQKPSVVDAEIEADSDKDKKG